MTKKQAVLELIFAGALWGFGFVATVWALEAFTAPELLAYRYFLAALAGEILALFFRSEISKVELKKDFLLAIPAGLILAGLMIFQTWGLKFTTATNAGFLTCLYVILVPFINSWFFRKTSSIGNYIRAFFALLGTLILMGGTFSEVNLGDTLMIVCAIFAAFHIIYIGTITHRLSSAFRFNNFQSFWCLIGLLPFLLWQQSFHFEYQNFKAWAGILSLALGSSLIAFYIQVRAQKILSDSTASMIFLLESPFAAIFGFFLLGERLSIFQTFGALIIMLASLLQILSEHDIKTI